MITQEELVIEHLKKYKTITHKDAYIKYGISRISAIIYNLREQNYKIKTVYETKPNKYGKKVTYARYILKEEENV